MCAICQSGKNRSCCGARGSSRLTLFSEVHLGVENVLQCRSDHRIKHIEVRTILSSNRSRSHKIVACFCDLNFFDPEHGDLRICCFLTNLSSGLPALKFRGVWKFSKIPFYNRYCWIKQVPAVSDSISLLLWK